MGAVNVKILLFGATGLTGQEILKQGLELGHELTAYVRNPQKISMIHHPMLSVHVGDAADTRSVVDAVKGYDVILSALGTGRSLKGDIFSVGIKNIIAGMLEHHVRRIVVMSAYGVGDSFSEASIPLRMVAKTLLKETFADKALAEEYLRQSHLDWTCVYPVMLTNGSKLGPGVYRSGEHIRVGIVPKISRADVADFMLRIAADDSAIRKTLVVSY
jgi:putative NADH-flavin reductase